MSSSPHLHLVLIGHLVAHWLRQRHRYKSLDAKFGTVAPQYIVPVSALLHRQHGEHGGPLSTQRWTCRNEPHLFPCESCWFHQLIKNLSAASRLASRNQAEPATAAAHPVELATPCCRDEVPLQELRSPTWSEDQHQDCG